MTCGDLVFVDLPEMAEGISPTIRERIVDESGELILTADVSTLKTYIYDISSGDVAATQVSTTITHTVASVWKDALQDEDGTHPVGGWNVGYQIDSSYFPGVRGVEKRYQIETWCHPVAGKDFAVTLARVSVVNTLKNGT